MKLLSILLGCWILDAGFSAFGASQFTAGYSFSDNTNSPQSIITSNRLRLLIESATIQPAAISAQTNMVVSPATNDTLLLWRNVNSNLTQVPIRLLIPTNLVTYGLTGGGGAPFAVNLDTNTLSFNDTNQLALSRSIQTSTNVTNADFALVYSTTASNWVRVTLSNIRTVVTNGLNITNTASYTGTNRTFALNYAHTNAHGLGGMPSAFAWRMVCTSADQGYAAGEEVAATSFTSDSIINAFVQWADATNVYIRTYAGTAVNVQPRTGGAYQAIATNKWALKPYATRVIP